MTGNAILQLQDVHKEFRSGPRFRAHASVKAVDGITIDVRQSETLGLVGESGSGKSTVARLITRLVEPTRGKILMQGRDLTALSTRAMRSVRRDIQMVFQDPYGSLDPRMTIRQLLAEPLMVHGVPAADAAQRIVAMVGMVGLDTSQLDRYPHQFSGGQRQRIGIARALILKPRILILDEPVSALDVSVQAQILNLISDLQRELDLTMIFIAHDLAVVRHVSHRVAVLYLGCLVEIGTREEIFDHPMHPYTRSLLSSIPIPDPVSARSRSMMPPLGDIGSASNLPSGCRFHPRCRRAREVAAEGKVPTCAAAGASLPVSCVKTDPELQVNPSGRRIACHFPVHGPLSEQTP